MACCRCSCARGDRLLAGTADAVDRAVARSAAHCRSVRATGAAVRAPLPRDRHALSGYRLIACTAIRGLWVWTRWCANTWATALIHSRCAECVSTLLSSFLTPYLNNHRPRLLSRDPSRREGPAIRPQNNSTGNATSGSNASATKRLGPYTQIVQAHFTFGMCCCGGQRWWRIRLPISGVGEKLCNQCVEMSTAQRARLYPPRVEFKQTALPRSCQRRH